jgi:hypothetical protein
MDQPLLARRAASADGSLTMITCEWVTERSVPSSGAVV